jgi:hypothetical protein
MHRKADFAGILGETISLFGDGWRGVLIFILVIGGLNAAGIALALAEPGGGLAGFGIGFHLDADSGPAVAGFELLTVVVSVVASYFLLVHLLEARNRFRAGETRVWAYIGMSILSSIGMIVGFVLLIVPGLILLVRWSAASGFLIGARKGVVQSLSASWEATKGHGWSIFGAGLVMLIGMAVIGGVLGGAGSLEGSETLFGFAAGLVDAISTAILLAFGIAVFVLVHNDEGELGEVFA